MIMNKVVITGASGLLGRAVFNHMAAKDNLQVQGWAFNRIHGGKFLKVNLSDDNNAVIETLNDFKPSFIVHCAAERRPDVVAKDPKGAVALNVGATKCLAQWASSNNVFMIYVSTDYVFGGACPPYDEQSKPSPLNDYGRHKLDGEKVVQGICDNYAILRVPILYGDCEYLGEGAVDVILKNLVSVQWPNAPERPAVMSHYERRCPTHVEDVAAALHSLMTSHIKDPMLVHGVYHWRGDEEMTKFDMCKAMAHVFSLSMDHVSADATKPPPDAAATRPYNSWLGRERLEKLGHTRNKYSFSNGVESLRKHVQS